MFRGADVADFHEGAKGKDAEHRTSPLWLRRWVLVVDLANVRITASIPAVQTLPIDDILPAILDAARTRRRLVLTAPPGSGKSTRVPPLLSEHVTGQTLLLQPRRVATRSLATRIAEERGWTLGGQVGYRVRFERVGNDDTKLWVMTEGTLTRRLLDDPYLEGVGCVI